MATFSFIYLSIILLFGSICLNAHEHNHEYEQGDRVYVWATGIGPRDNNQEIYKYSILPLCLSKEKLNELDHEHDTLGQNLLGKNMELTNIKIKFLDDVESKVFCTKSPEKLQENGISGTKLDDLTVLIKNKYQVYYEIDDLELMDSLGEYKEDPETETEKVSIYTQYDFVFKYNGNQIISVDLKPSNPKDIFEVANKGLKLKFSTKWEKTETKFEERLDLYFKKYKSEHKFRWFTVINSFLLVIFLAGVVVIILMRTLHKDFARYDQLDNMDAVERDFVDDYGWKQIHGDVFRPPRQALLLSSILGSGLQLLAMTLIVIVYVLANKLYLEEDKIVSGAIFFYSLSAVAGGVYSGNAYTKLGGRNYLMSAVLTASLFPVPVGILTFTSSIIASITHNSRVLTFFNIFIIFITWILMSVPLTYMGSLIGRHFAKYDEIPCRVHTIPRPIPPKPWYLENQFVILASGIVPFGSIFIELHTILNSFWNYKPYYLYGFLLLSFIVLICVTGCISIVGTYLMMNMEDYRWHWFSIGIGSSSVLYIYLYSLYYFYFKTSMHGVYQVTFYFFNTFLGGLALGLVLGMVGYYASYRFVRKIFGTVKID